MSRVPGYPADGKDRIPTDFYAGDGFCVELARVGRNASLGLVYCRNRVDIEYQDEVILPEYILVPPPEDEFTRHIRFAESVASDEALKPHWLLDDIDEFLSLCLDLDDRRRFLLASFVLSTWVVDWLPIAPYVAFVGLPGSGKSTALRALYLICRRGLMTYDISSAAFYRACDRLGPTLCIDEAATAGERRVLFHLLRSGTTRDAAAFRVGQSYRAYGAKAVSWSEMPDDEALNSRCIVIPMKETSNTTLLRTTDPKLLEKANDLQSLLFAYRLRRYGARFSRELPSHERLRARDRDLYEALALPLFGDRRRCACLLECFNQQQNVNQDPLPSKQVAVLGGLFVEIHEHPELGDYALREITKAANLWLRSTGERFHLNERTVSEILKTFGFVDRKRTKSGWIVSVDSATRNRLHELVWRYGVDVSHYVRTEPSKGRCEFCGIEEDDLHSRAGDDQTASEFDGRGWVHPTRKEVEREREEWADLWNVAEYQRSVLDPNAESGMATAANNPGSFLEPGQSGSKPDEHGERGEHQNGDGEIDAA